jgi:hypothetical protein
VTSKLGPSLELQVAYVTAIKSSADVKALIGDPPRINPERSKEWPGSYIELGDGQDVPDLAECIDGSELFHDIHIWSRIGTNFADVNKIAANLWAAISGATISLTENKLLEIERGNLQRFRDPDGISLHGVLTIRALTEPAA